jgi:hypothetical protein
MQLDTAYDIYFNNQGRCPECGEWLVPHIGCIGPIVEWQKKKEIKCSIRELSRKNYQRLPPLALIINYYKKTLSYKYARRNLDIQPEKSYFKIND